MAAGRSVISKGAYRMCFTVVDLRDERSPTPSSKGRGDTVNGIGDGFERALSPPPFAFEQELRRERWIGATVVFG
jgi:hypothetical protein